MSKVAYDKKDNWKDFDYKSRFLDAVASLFHSQGDCAAVLEYESKFYLSYNSSATPTNKKRIEIIRKTFNAKDHVNLLGVYLIFNVDFKNLVKKTRNHVDENLDKNPKDLLEGLLSNIQKAADIIDKNPKKIQNNSISLEDILIPAINKYEEVLTVFQHPKLSYHLNTFFRPMQDAHKIFHFYTKSYGDMEMNVEILENTAKYHAEYNITTHFPKLEYLDNKYIGISKLCCGYCHKSLEEDGYLHRGTHGICDDKWNMNSPQEYRFKKSAKKIKEFDQDCLPTQYRTLSIDDFEKEIESYYDLKQLLGLHEDDSKTE